MTQRSGPEHGAYLASCYFRGTTDETKCKCSEEPLYDRGKLGRHGCQPRHDVQWIDWSARLEWRVYTPMASMHVCRMTTEVEVSSQHWSHDRLGLVSKAAYPVHQRGKAQLPLRFWFPGL